MRYMESLLLCFIALLFAIPSSLAIHRHENIKYGDCPAVHDLLQSNVYLQKSILNYGAAETHHAEVFSLLNRQLKQGQDTHIMFTGSSITAIGYFVDFVDYLSVNESRKLTVVNLGRGAADTSYHLHCVPYEGNTPDVIFADFRFTDWQSDRLISEALFRKLQTLRRRDGGLPLLVLMHFGRVSDACKTNSAFFSPMIGQYGLSSIDLCLLTRYCFGHHNYEKWPLYSGDKVHPTTNLSRAFIADAMIEWWKTASIRYSTELDLMGSEASDPKAYVLPPPLHKTKALGSHTHCQIAPPENHITSGTSAMDLLMPLHTNGFVTKTRVKFGALSFQNVKSCWQGSEVGHSITFPFTGTTLQMAIYQNPENMGMIDAYLDQESTPRTTITGYFEGYEWAKQNGRQMVVPVFAGLSAGKHTVTFKINSQPANPKKPGHDVQIIALMFAE